MAVCFYDQQAFGILVNERFDHFHNELSVLNALATDCIPGILDSLYFRQSIHSCVETIIIVATTIMRLISSSLNGWNHLPGMTCKASLL